MTVGQKFRWPPFDVYLLDKELRDLRAQLAFFLGYGDQALVDSKTLLVAQGGHLLLVAKRPTCQPSALAREIYLASGRRNRPFRVLDPRAGLKDATVRPVFAQATQGTIYLDLAALDTVPDHVARYLFGDEFGVRAILSAPSVSEGERKLERTREPYARLLDGDIAIPTVASHADDVPRMLDVLLAELQSSHRVVELGHDRLAALSAYQWPEDVAQLRRAAERINAYLTHGSMKAAAEALGLTPQTLHRMLHKIGAVAGRSPRN